MDHPQIDHLQMDHLQIDHLRMDHLQMDHLQMDHLQMDRLDRLCSKQGSKRESENTHTMLTGSIRVKNGACVRGRSGVEQLTHRTDRSSTDRYHSVPKYEDRFDKSIITGEPSK